MDSMINWQKKDEARLQKAINQFNEKINKLQKEEKRLYLPEKVKYENIKEDITTRKELERRIASFERFLEAGAEAKYTTKAGEDLTKWEREELGRSSKIAQTRITKRLNELNKPQGTNKYSRVQMGSAEEKQLKSTLKNLKELEMQTGYDFKLTKDRILNQGVTDYKMKQAINFKNNYLMVMEQYKYYEGYDKLMAKLNSFTNPMSFYQFLKDTGNEFYYDPQYQSDQVYSQEEFNVFLNDLGIETDDIQTKTVEDLKRQVKAENYAFEKLSERFYKKHTQ